MPEALDGRFSVIDGVRPQAQGSRSLSSLIVVEILRRGAG